MKRRHLFSLPLLALILLVGCSSKTAGSKVSGKVTYNGAPVPGGDVSFYSEQGVYTGHLQKDGTYEIVDMPPGEFTVTVNTEIVKPKPKEVYKGQSSGTTGKYGKTAPDLQQRKVRDRKSALPARDRRKSTRETTWPSPKNMRKRTSPTSRRRSRADRKRSTSSFTTERR